MWLVAVHRHVADGSILSRGGYQYIVMWLMAVHRHVADGSTSSCGGWQYIVRETRKHILTKYTLSYITDTMASLPVLQHCAICSGITTFLTNRNVNQPTTGTKVKTHYCAHARYAYPNTRQHRVVYS